MDYANFGQAGLNVLPRHGQSPSKPQPPPYLLSVYRQGQGPEKVGWGMYALQFPIAMSDIFECARPCILDLLQE